MASLLTVLVAAPQGGSMLINQRDFDPLVHQRYEEDLSDAAPAEADATGEGVSDPESSALSDYGTAAAAGLATAQGFVPPALEVAVELPSEASPLAVRIAELREAFTLSDLREKAKAYGLKGLARANELAAAEAIAQYELKVEADHVSY